MLAVLAAGGVGVLAWLALRGPREPVYQGKRLSAWLHDYDTRTGRPHADADEAVRNIGTNALPFLLRLFRENDSSFKFRALRLLGKQHFVKISHTPARTLNEEAMYAIKALGARASNAVPGLIHIYNQNLSADAQWTVAYSLSSIGPAASNAVPILLTRACTAERLNSTNWIVCESAITALGQIHGQPAMVVPAFMEVLRRRNTDAERWMAIALGEFGSDAKPAVPLLIKCYDDQKNRDWKADIGAAIKKIDPETAAKAWVQ